MKFNYITKTSAGQTKSGVIEARNKQNAIDALQKAGLVIVSLRAKERVPLFAHEIRIFQRVKSKELVSFSRQFAVLFGAKISLIEAIKTTSRQTENTYFKEILNKISSDVEAGAVLSRALGKYPKIFSPFYINMVKAGEVSGNLEETLNYLADYVEKQYYLNSRIIGALIYPILILFGFTVVGIAMLIFVIPQLTAILTESGQAMPLPTRVIIGLSNILRVWGWLMGILLAGLIAGGVYYLKISLPARKFLDSLKLKIPMFGAIFQKFYLARFSESLATLIKGGVSILQALEVSAEVVGNLMMRSIILEARDEVRVGNPMSVVLEKSKEIPYMVSQMVAVGERTGSIDIVLKKIADFYTKEVDSVVSVLSQLIEPILIIILGMGVGILVASILMPIYNIAGGF